MDNGSKGYDWKADRLPPPPSGGQNPDTSELAMAMMPVVNITGESVLENPKDMFGIAPPPPIETTPKTILENASQSVDIPDILLQIPDRFIPKPIDEHFDSTNYKSYLDYGLPIPRDILEALTTGSAPKGWKFHLNIDYTDPQVVTAVRQKLTELEMDKALKGFKIGSGGGDLAGAPGKEVTVYAGSHEDAIKISDLLELNLTGLLLPPRGDVLTENTEFSPKVWGRFSHIDNDFINYGYDGIPILESDNALLRKLRANPDSTYKGLSGTQAQKLLISDALTKARKLLKYRYGDFFDS